MTTTQLLTRFTCVYLLLNLAIAHLLGVPLTASLAPVFTYLVSLAIFVVRERKRGNRSRENSLHQLTRLLVEDRRAWQHLNDEWIGRTVWLKEDILNLREPEGLQLYVRAGTQGTIVALNRDEYAPFTVKFPGFGHKVVVRLDKLDVPLDEDSAGNVPAKRRASLWQRLTSPNPFPPRVPFVYDDYDGDDIPEDAEAFVDEMRHFAALDWHVWTDQDARRVYQQMRHYEN